MRMALTWRGRCRDFLPRPREKPLISFGTETRKGPEKRRSKRTGSKNVGRTRKRSLLQQDGRPGVPGGSSLTWTEKTVTEAWTGEWKPEGVRSGKSVQTLQKRVNARKKAPLVVESREKKHRWAPTCNGKMRPGNPMARCKGRGPFGERPEHRFPIPGKNDSNSQKSARELGGRRTVPTKGPYGLFKRPPWEKNSHKKGPNLSETEQGQPPQASTGAQLGGTRTTAKNAFKRQEILLIPKKGPKIGSRGGGLFSSAEVSKKPRPP